MRGAKKSCGGTTVFETPIIIFFLARLGIVTPAFLLQKFKYAVVLAFVISAIVTPTPDMVTQTVFAAPMIVLYGISIVLAFFASPARRRKQDGRS